MENYIYTIIVFTILLLGMWKIYELFASLVHWITNKLKILMYGEPVEPYCLFKIEEWYYDENRIVDRFKI